jgi:DNA-binding NarL/FixJ family response regulator
MGKIKVLIADDHAVVRMGLASLLTTNKEVDVVGDAFDGEDAVRKTLKLKPDVIVMDLMMPRKDGVTATAEIHEKSPGTKILLLTTFSSSENIAKALKAGALGAVMKSSSNDELISAILSVARGERFLSSDVEQLLAEDPPVPDLSQRQIQILESVGRGLTNKEISTQLEIGLESVKSHIKIILEKLGAANRAEAVSIASKKHLLKD